MEAPAFLGLKASPFTKVASAFCMLCTAAFTVPAAQAQTIGYNTALNTIGPASITQINFDSRRQSTVQSISPAGLENNAAVTPAVFDSATGRFLSALGNSRGAIAVGPANQVLVTVTTLQSTFVIATGSGASVRRTDTLNSPSAAVALPQITTLPSTNPR